MKLLNIRKRGTKKRGRGVLFSAFKGGFISPEPKTEKEVRTLIMTGYFIPVYECPFCPFTFLIEEKEEWKEHIKLHFESEPATDIPAEPESEPEIPKTTSEPTPEPEIPVSEETPDAPTEEAKPEPKGKSRKPKKTE